VLDLRRLADLLEAVMGSLGSSSFPLSARIVACSRFTA
jgi:hypothetical protein